MSELKYSFRTDALFKILFGKYQSLLKKFVGHLLEINLEDIVEFVVINPEISAEEMKDKFCRLDIRMVVNGQLVDLEIQVMKRKDYTDRCLFYWARQFSTGIEEGEKYSELPRSIIISIMDFVQFPNREKAHSEYQCLEVESHEPLTDKQVLHFFELPKLVPPSKSDSSKELWLKLFKVRTEEELIEIDRLEVPEMTEAIKAYRHIASSNELANIARALSDAGHEKAQALSDARDEGMEAGIKQGEEQEREKWQGVVSEKDAIINELRAKLAMK